MRIALPYDQETKSIYPHTGRCTTFKVYHIENNQLESSEFIQTDGELHAALPAFLKNHDIDILICSGCGDRLFHLLKEANITCYTNQEGDCDSIIQSFLNETMEKIQLPTHCCQHRG